jgi:protein HIRA/HIR1
MERCQINSGNSNETVASHLEMLVVTADGVFTVYILTPALRLVYKGSVVPAMTHMSLGCLSFSQEERPLPRLSRIQITDRGRLFLLLSLDSALQPNNHRHMGGGDRTGGTRTTAIAVDGGAGGALQAFVYDRASELWLRIADSRFVLSDFYSALPSSSTIGGGILSKMDDAVRLGSLQSSLKPSHRGRLSDRQAETIYSQVEDDSGNFIASRSHCEDRMACAVALGSASDFKQWLLFYVRALALRGHTSLIRSLVDLLLGAKIESSLASEVEAGRERIGCWWLSAAPSVLNLERVALVRAIVIPEVSKNRSLQRLTNEIALEIENQG